MRSNSEHPGARLHQSTLKMKTIHRGHRGLIAVCCLYVLAVHIPAYATMVEAPLIEDRPGERSAPVSQQQQCADQLLERMLTPQAEIRIGPGNADTERLMRRSNKHSLTYVVRSLWSGIVEYLFPEHGLFRRGSSLARIYDPTLLDDLERARDYAASSEVSPLTIRSMPPRVAAPEVEAAQPSGAAEVAPPVMRPPEVAAPALPRQPEQEPVRAEPVRISFDFEANQQRQDQLREQAEFTAAAVAAAMDNRRSAHSALDEARAELEDRRRLLDQGVLAAQAVEPAEERVAATRAGLDRAEAELVELQQGYERLAERITKLEGEAAEAHEAMKRARNERARQAEAAERRQVRQARERAAAELQAQRRTAVAEPRPEATAAPAPAAELVESSAEPEQPAVAGSAATREMRELAAPRWEDVGAEAPGLVSDVLAPEGTVVEAGDELLRVANLQLAQLGARIGPEHLGQFRVGRSVTITFEDYPDIVFDGWVASIEPCSATNEVEVGLLVVCNSGRFADDPYLALRWMTLEAGVEADEIASKKLDPVMHRAASTDMELRLQRIFPTMGPRALYSMRAEQAQVPADDRYTGRLRLLAAERVASDAVERNEPSVRLAALADWRRTYVEGMTTSILGDGTCVTYPAAGNASTAIRAMLRGEVNHRPNLCAATMREALGWGLGDAHRWATQLPRMGYIAREDRLPRPGDILVWPFTYGPNRTQHIGFAVRQGRQLMLLSNLSGTLGTTEILDGYIAFYRPDEEPEL